MWPFLYRLASPQSFYQWTRRWSPLFGFLSAILFLTGSFWGLFLAPADYLQGEGFRIIYFHVPAAFLSLCVYSVMSFCAVLILVWRIKLATIILRECIPIGAMMTFLALVTGAIWGKPMWGTWWIWDARLTSELILLFVYLGLYVFSAALTNAKQSSAILATLTLVGLIDLPIIHYSVNWWNTLHQGASLSALKKPSIDTTMLWPLLIMIASFLLFFIYALLSKANVTVLWENRRSKWVNELVKYQE